MHPFFRLYKLTYSESVKNFQVFETLHDQFQDNNYPSKRMVSVQCTLILKRKLRRKQICFRKLSLQVNAYPCSTESLYRHHTERARTTQGSSADRRDCGKDIPRTKRKC